MISLFVAQIYANKSYVWIKIKKKEYFLTYLSHTLRNSVQNSPPTTLKKLVQRPIHMPAAARIY